MIPSLLKSHAYESAVSLREKSTVNGAFPCSGEAIMEICSSPMTERDKTIAKIMDRNKTPLNFLTIRQEIALLLKVSLKPLNPSKSSQPPPVTDRWHARSLRSLGLLAFFPPRTPLFSTTPRV